LPVLQNVTLNVIPATVNAVDARSPTASIPVTNVAPLVASSPTATAVPHQETATNAHPNEPNPDAEPFVNAGNQGSTSIEPGQAAIPSEEIANLLAFPDLLAIRVDAATVNAAVDQLVQGLEAVLPDPLDGDSFWVRLGYWVIAVSATAVGFELVRQDLRSRRRVRADVHLTVQGVG
jgi:hypothetical protein